MKIPIWNATALTVLALGGPVRADIVYSNVNTGIATTYSGTTVNVGDGSLNLFFGGAGLANNSTLQPFRIGSGTVDGMNTILKLSNNTFVSVSSGGLATGAGGSIDHLGSQFSVGTDGYLGFKLDDADYGWMRVQLTYAASGGLVRDWAYDNTGAAIKTGWINTDVVSSTAQTITLNPATGEAFTLSSTTPLVNAGATITNSVVKNGDGTAVLTGINTYTGTTAVNAGVLLVNGSLTGGGALSVAAPATLGGTGSITGAVEVSGTLAPGASIESLASGALTFNDGATFAYEMNSVAAPGVAGDLQRVSGGVTLAHSSGEKVYLTLTDLASSPTAFAPGTTLSLINYTGAWNGGLFTYGSNELSDGEQFTADLNTWQIHYGATQGGLNFAGDFAGPDSHFINLTLSLTAIPEPGSWITLGCLVGSGAFLRRRK